jgi:acyl-CoA hydrolase
MGKMLMNELNPKLAEMAKLYPEKFVSEESVFGNIHPGNRIFIGTGCGEPQYLVGALITYVRSHPKAFFDAELLQVWTLGVVPYADEKFKDTFRHNSFFIGNNTREAVNRGAADYTPLFLSQVPALFHSKAVPVDVALIQTSLPDDHGYMSLGISVDIVKAATENAALVIAQVNSRMPRVHGETFIHIRNVNFIVPRDEPLLEFEASVSDDIAQRIGTYVARIVQDGDTIQVGYGSIPNAILGHLLNKKHLGVHTELLTDGIVALMKQGVIDNSRKELNRGKTVAAFCMGKRDTYEYLHDNPSVEFRPVNYTNNPTVLARQKNMTAINSALEIDLTGQATAESIGKTFYSGIGGQADFMRGAILSPGARPSGAPVHGRERRDIEDRPVFERRRGRDHHPGRRPLRRHGVRHCLPPRKEHQGARHGSDRHSPSHVPPLAHRGGQAAQSDLSGPGLRHGRRRGVSGAPRDLPDHQGGVQPLPAAREDQR